jgi:hypothetical protein
MTTAFLVPMNNNGPQLGFGFAYPPVTYPFWADRVPASGATIQPGQDLTLVFGVTRTTDANGHSNGPMIVYTSPVPAWSLALFQALPGTIPLPLLACSQPRYHQSKNRTSRARSPNT